ncbi:ATP-binding protein [Actinacidiphila acidipaludis]|uniref:ATP-binding protein n=1 Tax=Actinacidiphila acidipaludis TaxID=2873382 RepID=A0ABS7Q2E8_9ACTN|nr:ATP-binding protein [Streptomyces acidipaludis]MBY8877300.1 ATP-binding protein [Streptomyces acidipaludis]
MTERILPIAQADGQIALARDWARQETTAFAWSAGWRPDAGVVALVLSELVTNALLHAPGEATLSLIFEPRGLRIVVSDGSRRPPVEGHAARTQVGGHGLDIVAALSHDWGVIQTAAGKQVWADLTDARSLP